MPFIEGRPLKRRRTESYFDLPAISHRTGSLFEHAALAVRHGLRFGSHGLPLMGAGDWNDGMNQVGHHGRGESVWLGFFLCEVLREFSLLARSHLDDAFAQTCDGARDKLAVALETHAWDGDWYRRAYFDDGTALGSHDSPECRIDSIAQSWSVLSGVAPRERALRAMNALATRLISPQQRIVRLLDPPFNRAGPNPGYIAGYVPGVRENGGQYTHGAVWAAMAFAACGDARRAWEILDMINPVNHARTPAEVAVYKVEPYVVAADVYSVAPHTGRGGWSWYTGSAGWMYRLVVEADARLLRLEDAPRAAPRCCSTRACRRTGTASRSTTAARGHALPPAVQPQRRPRDGRKLFLDGRALADRAASRCATTRASTACRSRCRRRRGCRPGRRAEVLL